LQPVKCSPIFLLTFSLKALILRPRISSTAFLLSSALFGVFKQIPSFWSFLHWHSGPQVALLARHMQYSFRHWLFLHLHPAQAMEVSYSRYRENNCSCVMVSSMIFSVISFIFSSFSFYYCSFSMIERLVEWFGAWLR
jgi:hypothetical protein